MHSKALKKFIHKNSHLFWYTPADKLEQMSDELILEHILNYADLITIKEYFKIVGLKKAYQLFNNMKGRKKGNIYPEIYALFSAFFKKHAQKYT
jgi:hypothetical protein